MDVNQRIEDQLKSHEVLLYMKGTPDFPQCGFSGQTVAALISGIDEERQPDQNLSSAARLFVLNWYRAKSGLLS